MTGKVLEDLQRLRLRSLRQSDLAPFSRYRSDPAVARLQGWEPLSRQEAAELLADLASADSLVAGQWTQIGIAERSTDRLIGDLGVYLSPDLSSAEFGITITPAAQGQGFATEAIRGLLGLLFTTTPVSEVLACTDVRNGSCIAALRRAGMIQGEERQAEYKGEICSEIVFSAQRPEG